METCPDSWMSHSARCERGRGAQFFQHVVRPVISVRPFDRPASTPTRRSILFGLFVGFSSAEITQGGGSLRLSTQQEVSAARSILNVTTGVGPRAYSVRQVMIEYLQVVTTTERDWLKSRALGDPPGTGPVYSLNLITTGFAQRPAWLRG